LEHNGDYGQGSGVCVGLLGWQDAGMEKGMTPEAAAAAGAAAGAAAAARLWRAGRGTARLLCRPAVALPPGRVLCDCIVDECCEAVDVAGGAAP
jgi:hypothetical protein